MALLYTGTNNIFDTKSIIIFIKYKWWNVVYFTIIFCTLELLGSKVYWSNMVTTTTTENNQQQINELSSYSQREQEKKICVWVCCARLDAHYLKQNGKYVFFCPLVKNKIWKQKLINDEIKSCRFNMSVSMFSTTGAMVKITKQFRYGGNFNNQ